MQLGDTMTSNSNLMPSGYRPRIADRQIEQYLKLFGAVEISGTKWCGKTWSALAHGQSVTYVDRGNNLQLVEMDPAYALAGSRPHVIDEWQRVPAVWDTVRHAVDDAGSEKGAWILTGSSTPVQADAKAHSGAGRIGRVRMHTMSLAETGDSTAQVSLTRMFEGEFEQVQCPDGVRELATIIVRGGWPAEIGMPPEDVQVVIGEYLRLVFDEGVPRFGGNAEVARRTARSIARNLGQSPTNATMARDVYALGADDQPSDAQMREVRRHVDILRRLYMLDEVTGWVPASRSPRRMRTKPRFYFADQSLPVALLGLSVDALLQDGQTFGLAFENMVMRDLSVYAAALPGAGERALSYYHDDSNLEVDAIIERMDGSWGAIEVKLSPCKVDEGAANLQRLERKLLMNETARNRPPSFRVVITGTGDMAYCRPDGVYVVPIRALGA